MECEENLEYDKKRENSGYFKIRGSVVQVHLGPQKGSKTNRFRAFFSFTFYLPNIAVQQLIVFQYSNEQELFFSFLFKLDCISFRVK